MELIFEKSRPGRQASSLPPCDVPETPIGDLLDGELLRDSLDLPEVAEIDLVRHYTALARRNFGVDLGFYPLGSCTMKYNPKIHEDLAGLNGFSGLHPYTPPAWCQGLLGLLYDLERSLAEIFGMAAFSLQPAAGAHGELTGIMIFKRHFERKGERRRRILIPDTAHGTNPASGALCGYMTVTIPSDREGGVDLERLESLMGEDCAGLMLTNPNTLGLFERRIEEIAAIVHRKGGLLYGDGANANAFLGQTRPGDQGFDVIHINLHKTFSSPHGGGGPGSGPVGVVDSLVPYLPVPRIVRTKEGFGWEDDGPCTIGRVKAFSGQIGVLLRAYAYIRALGPAGLKRASALAVLNANYLRQRLQNRYDLPYGRACMHECVFSGQRQVRENGSIRRIWPSAFSISGITRRPSISPWLSPRRS
jgi:glycine dehydrogenase subunit 2